MAPTDSDAEGVHAERVRATKPGESNRPSPSTRIDMLPVMSSTGEQARVSVCWLGVSRQLPNIIKTLYISRLGSLRQ